LLLLGIETSCDETAVAVVEDGKRILSNIVLSQVPLHEEFFGVVPEVASRAHDFWLLPVVKTALKKAGISLAEIDAVAVTQGPGLIGALLVGLTAAKTLVATLGVPLVGVDHLQAHIYSAFIGDGLTTPAVALVVSGGHTSLYRVASPIEVELLGRTVDDAAGEAFDKVARMLGLSYPGGPAIEKAAEGGDGSAVNFPRPMLTDESLDFSFSGLKTAVLYHLRGQNAKGPAEPPDDVADIAASFQEAVVDVLVGKCIRALEFTSIRSLTVTGGVAANKRLRQRLVEEAERRNIKLHLPPLALCTDNAAMVAGLGYHLLAAGVSSPLDIDSYTEAKNS